VWVDQLVCDVTKANITALFCVKIMFGFHYLMPLLELLHELIKMAQAWDIYVLDSIKVMKLL
jgi:hypothetical protein